MNSAMIPPQVKGKESDLEYPVTLTDRPAAIALHKLACERLMNPNIWHELGGMLSATFSLTAPDGSPKQRPAQPGDLVRIDVPGPGTTAGAGYDWVSIENMEDRRDAAAKEELVAMQLRPCSNPAGQDNDTAHFFTNSATSTIVVARKGNTVSASYHGRNEVPNTNAGATADKIRNGIVASGALAFLSELQWGALCKGLLKKENE